MISRALVVGLVLVIAGTTIAAPLPVEEIRPGILRGYLPPQQLPNAGALLPPAPSYDSAQANVDRAQAVAMLALQGSARWQQATVDAQLHFPEALQSFRCALGVEISEGRTPYLYQLTRRTLADAGLATYSAKNLYNRDRPFEENGAPICTPEQREELEDDGSYPSGHTAIGWAWALIYSELLSERRDALLARGYQFGESRSVCNVHWASDIAAGRLIGSAAVAALHSSAEFMADLAEAKRELATAPIARGCSQ
ncbi:MAG: acid phosphatase [Porticoccaceae bacterium]